MISEIVFVNLSLMETKYPICDVTVFFLFLAKEWHSEIVHAICLSLERQDNYSTYSTG